MKKILKTNTFACFSPPVMIATFCIEIFLALRILYKYKTSTVVHIVIAMLCALATFQLAEYGVCEHVGLGGSSWATVGFTAITLLPPLGVHLAYALANKKPSWIVTLSYVLAAAWVGVFVFGSVMEEQICQGNYVIFSMKQPTELIYYTYYNALTVLAIGRAWMFAIKSKRTAQKQALHFLILGFLSFIVPSIIVRFIFEFDEGTSSALPSIMCGFAVLLALIISLKVIPTVSKRRVKR